MHLLFVCPWLWGLTTETDLSMAVSFVVTRAVIALMLVRRRRELWSDLEAWTCSHSSHPYRAWRWVTGVRRCCRALSQGDLWASGGLCEVFVANNFAEGRTLKCCVYGAAVKSIKLLVLNTSCLLLFFVGLHDSKSIPHNRGLKLKDLIYNRSQTE